MGMTIFGSVQKGSGDVRIMVRGSPCTPGALVNTSGAGIKTKRIVIVEARYKHVRIQNIIQLRSCHVVSCAYDPVAISAH